MPIISTANRDFWEMVTRTQFREDLYYRLLMETISVPPLRERKEEIPCRAFHFLETVNEKVEMQKIMDQGLWESVRLQSCVKGRNMELIGHPVNRMRFA